MLLFSSVLNSGFFQPEKAHKSLLGHFGYYLEELGQPSDYCTAMECQYIPTHLYGVIGNAGIVQNLREADR